MKCIVFLFVFLLCSPAFAQTYMRPNDLNRHVSSPGQGQKAGQKPLIDSSAYRNWPSVENPAISNDGKYVIYSINNVPDDGRTLVLQSTQTDWKTTFLGELNNPQFTDDSKYLIFQKGKDSLVIITLGSNNTRFITNISSYKITFNKGHSWISYTLSSKPKILFLKDLNTGKERYYPDVVNHWFSEDGKVLVINPVSKDRPGISALDLIDMADGKPKRVWEGAGVKVVVFDTRHNQLAFEANGSLWHYKQGAPAANCIISRDSFQSNKSLVFSRSFHFSKDGERIFYRMGERKKSEPKKANVQIWSYTDPNLPFYEEDFSRFVDKSYLFTIGINNHKIVPVQQANELAVFPSDGIGTDTIALIENEENILDEWSTARKSRNILLFLKSGERKYIDQLNNKRNVCISRFGKYLIYFDSELHNYFTYEIKTGIIRNITNGIPVSWISLDHNDYQPEPRAINSILWSKNDTAALIYDQFDIWKIDPLNKKKPVNVTNGYGLKNHIVFNFLPGQDIPKSNKIILSAFNTENKSNGFFSIKLDKKADPELFTMGPYFYIAQVYGNYVPYGSDFAPLKAGNAEMYLVRRMSATQAPNYFCTKDFTTFKQLSNLQPEKKYNWYTSELHTWNSLDGRKLQGILYKPENFDPNKKYPVIFHYYERKSNGLNVYMEPEWNGATIDIPTYVSNGYLVFCPDIYYKAGDPMQGTYDAVVSAAQYLSTLSFVNPQKMGLQGHSFGGSQTNYLVTHTNIFSAAVSSSGFSDWVSHYGTLYAINTNYYETSQGNIKASLWEKPEAYIKNSSIFQIDEVATPILLIHGIKDQTCPFSNIVEFFTGLRRMGKKCWMIAYPDAGHVRMGKDAEDMSIRTMQFFDHYLKDKPVPMWMTKGSSFINETQNGYQYDTEVKTPGPGLLTKKEQQKVDSLMKSEPRAMKLK